MTFTHVMTQEDRGVKTSVTGLSQASRTCSLLYVHLSNCGIFIYLNRAKKAYSYIQLKFSTSALQVKYNCKKKKKMILFILP